MLIDISVPSTQILLPKAEGTFHPSTPPLPQAIIRSLKMQESGETTAGLRLDSRGGMYAQTKRVFTHRVTGCHGHYPRDCDDRYLQHASRQDDRERGVGGAFSAVPQYRLRHVRIDVWHRLPGLPGGLGASSNSHS